MLNRARIVEICEPFARDGDFAVGGEIARKKLENARASLKIPAYDPVVALADFTVWGSNKNGLAICERAVYWDGGLGGGKGSLTWPEFAEAELRMEDGTLKIGRELHLLGSVGLGMELLHKLLGELQAAAANAPAPATSDADEAFVGELAAAIADFRAPLTAVTGSGFYLEGSIPEKKQAAATHSFPIPPDERVLALLDFTLFGSGKTGLAITLQGIYWRGTTGSDGGALSWRELSKVDIYTKGNWVVMGELGKHAMGGVLKGDDIARLLNSLQRVYAAHLDRVALRSEGSAQSGPAAGGASAVDPRFEDLAGLVLLAVSELDLNLGVRTGTHYHTGSEIPAFKRALAHERFGVPDTERVLGLFDLSDEGHGTAGIAVCTRGLFWRNASEPAGRSFSWPELAVAEPRADPADPRLIRMGAQHTIYTPNWSRRDELLRTIEELRGWARTHYGASATTASAPAAPAFGAAPPPPPPAVGARRWMLSTGGNQTGPFDDAAIGRMLRVGELDPEACFAWTEGMPQWLPLRQIPDLDLLVAPPPPMPPPPPPPAMMAPPPPPGAGKRVIDF